MSLVESPAHAQPALFFVNMPTGAPYQGHVPPYPAIRVDAFSVPREGNYHVAHLHLLTHTHSDHIMGLESTSFGQLVVCSQDAKNMLLRAEKYPDRIAFDQKRISSEVRPWAHLRTQSRTGKKTELVRDLLVRVFYISVSNFPQTNSCLTRIARSDATEAYSFKQTSKAPTGWGGNCNCNCYRCQPLSWLCDVCFVLFPD